MKKKIKPPGISFEAPDQHMDPFVGKVLTSLAAHYAKRASKETRAALASIKASGKKPSRARRTK